MYGHDIFGHIMWFMAVSKYIICCKKNVGLNPVMATNNC